eukprot:scaffold17957_cov79-Cyclotella_meneghiniana.AAC.6
MLMLKAETEKILAPKRRNVRLSGIKTEKIIAVLKKDDTAAKKFEDNVAATTARAQKSRKDEEITLRIIDLDTRVEYLMKLTRCMKMSVLMNAYAKRKGVQRDSLRFLLNGEGINPEDNPEILELEDRDQIDAMLACSGC